MFLIVNSEFEIPANFFQLGATASDETVLSYDGMSPDSHRMLGKGRSTSSNEIQHPTRNALDFLMKMFPSEWTCGGC